MESFAEIAYPPLPVKGELVSYALLELVSNSLRAHRERGVGEPVRVGIEARDKELSVTILDAGRGFDPSRLPYKLDEPVDRIDLMGAAFAAYRERYGGSRFGMGIYVAKTVFPRFQLSFVDRENKPCPWYSGAVRGTRIDLGLPILSPGLARRELDPVTELEAAP